MKRAASRVAGLAAGVIFATFGLALPATANDYPTEARVDYVLGCMAANGQDYLVMQKCSCSIDVIADLLSYDDYEAAETVLRMRDRRGELGVMFRTSPALEERMQSFRMAQAEADLRCF